VGVGVGVPSAAIAAVTEKLQSKVTTRARVMRMRENLDFCMT
jgi:hypothetical protein